MTYKPVENRRFIKYKFIILLSDYRSRGPGLIPGHYKKKVVGLERGPLSLLSTTEELLDRKSSGSCLENRE
jgi:hypothetical protein